MAAAIDFPVPKDFPSILKALTRELLRSFPDPADQTPENILLFGADYFTEILEQIRAAEQGGPQRRMDPEEMREYLTNLFINADTDGSGALSITEFKQVIRAFQQEGLEMSKADIRRLHQEVDLDGNGEIDYNEFLPPAIELIQSIYARMDMAAEEEQAKADAETAATEYLVHGMSKSEVEAIIREQFDKADADKSGSLDVPEFHKCLKEAELGLKKNQIVEMMMEADINQDGSIEFDEFFPVCWRVLQAILRDEILLAEKDKMKKSPTDFEAFLIAAFQKEDDGNSGQLPMAALRGCIRDLDLGLSRLQIHSVLSLAECGADTMVSYEELAIKAAEMIARLLDPLAMVERGAVLGETGPVETVRGFSQEYVTGVIFSACRASDPTETGHILFNELRDALATCELELSPREIAAMMSTVDVVDRTGMAAYGPVAEIAFNLLRFLAQEEMMAAGGY